MLCFTNSDAAYIMAKNIQDCILVETVLIYIVPRDLYLGYTTIPKCTRQPVIKNSKSAPIALVLMNDADAVKKKAKTRLGVCFLRRKIHTKYVKYMQSMLNIGS
jgi:hypothetical protein